MSSPSRAAAVATDGPRGPARTPFVLRVPLAVASGLLLWLAFPTHDLWWAAPLGVTAFTAATLGTTLPRAFLLGLAGGLAVFVPTLSWSGIYVGVLPWLALATTESLYVAVMALVTTWVWRRLDRAGRPGLGYVAVPVGWVLQELVRGSLPFGGFPWARLAFSQADGPLVRLATYGGAPLVTFAVAATGAALLAVLLSLRPLAPRALVVSLVLAVATPVVGALVRLPVDGRHERVALVQGNVPEPGLNFNAERRKVLDNHVRGTLDLAARDPGPLALVVWPENASDIDPLRNADAASEIAAAVDTVGAPVLLGAILDEPAPKVSNASLYYRPGHTGTPERYVKQHPVPFAEYVPYRDFFRLFSDKVDLVRAGFAAGTGPAAFQVGTGDAAWWAVPTICFEVAYDGLVRDAVTQPGREDNILVVQTNNATFGYSAESEQQFAISRLRAIEHGRSVAHVSTVGVSAMINPDGTYQRKTRLFTADQVVGDAVIRGSLTVADRIGALPEILAGAALVLLVIAGRARRRSGRVATVAPSDDAKEALSV